MIRMLGINGIEAVHGRVEAFGKDPDFAGRFDGVLARGLANLERLADLADQFLTPGAILFALKSPAPGKRSLGTWKTGLPLRGMNTGCRMTAKGDVWHG